MKIMYLDESGDHSLTKIDKQFPIFCLSGCIFDENDYQDNARSRIDAFKIRYFNTNKIILHSREIRKCEPPFNILLNKVTKESFYRDLNQMINDLKFTIIAAVILKEKLRDQYTDPSNPYSLSLHFILERFLYFLEEQNDQGYLVVESRDPKSNTDLLNTFTDLVNNGSAGDSHRVNAARFQAKLLKMTFETKQENENGLQVADLAAYPIAKYGQDRLKPNPAFEVLQPKFRKHNDTIFGGGLKIFP